MPFDPFLDDFSSSSSPEQPIMTAEDFDAQINDNFFEMLMNTRSFGTDHRAPVEATTTTTTRSAPVFNMMNQHFLPSEPQLPIYESDVPATTGFSHSSPYMDTAASLSSGGDTYYSSIPPSPQDVINIGEPTQWDIVANMYAQDALVMTRATSFAHSTDGEMNLFQDAANNFGQTFCHPPANMFSADSAGSTSPTVTTGSADSTSTITAGYNSGEIYREHDHRAVVAPYQYQPVFDGVDHVFNNPVQAYDPTFGGFPNFPNLNMVGTVDMAKHVGMNDNTMNSTVNNMRNAVNNTANSASAHVANTRVVVEARNKHQSGAKKAELKHLASAGPRRVKLDNTPAGKQLGGAPRRIGAPKQKCTTCGQGFFTKLEMRSHMDQYHARMYTCIFNFAGCASTFPNKNEWKRHVITQHLALKYWVCTEGACASIKNDNSLPDGGIFNRKDLYTQHIRRMHVPAEFQKAVADKNSPPAWVDMLANLQASAEKERVQLPTNMTCPHPACSDSFSGPECWDGRMEHVARHLERSHVGEEQPIVFGGYNDPTLTCWAEAAGVIGKTTTTASTWQLCEPLKVKAGSGRGGKSGGRVVVIFAADSESDDGHSSVSSVASGSSHGM